MRTTNKQFTEQVQNHIIESLSEDHTTRLNEQLANTVASFNNWYNAYEQKRTPNQSKAFQDWLMCLPSEIHAEYSYYNIHVTLKSWFENCGEVYKEQDSAKESELYLHLFTREFAKLCKKNEVLF